MLEHIVMEESPHKDPPCPSQHLHQGMDASKNSKMMGVVLPPPLHPLRHPHHSTWACQEWYRAANRCQKLWVSSISIHGYHQTLAWYLLLRWHGMVSFSNGVYGEPLEKLGKEFPPFRVTFVLVEVFGHPTPFIGHFSCFFYFFRQFWNPISAPFPGDVFATAV